MAAAGVWAWAGQGVATPGLSVQMWWLVVRTASAPCQHALLPALTAVLHSLPAACSPVQNTIITMVMITIMIITIVMIITRFIIKNKNKNNKKNNNSNYNNNNIKIDT